MHAPRFTHKKGLRLVISTVCGIFVLIHFTASRRIPLLYQPLEIYNDSNTSSIDSLILDTTPSSVASSLPPTFTPTSTPLRNLATLRIEPIDVRWQDWHHLDEFVGQILNAPDPESSGSQRSHPRSPLSAKSPLNYNGSAQPIAFPLKNSPKSHSRRIDWILKQVGKETSELDAVKLGQQYLEEMPPPSRLILVSDMTGNITSFEGAGILYELQHLGPRTNTTLLRATRSPVVPPVRLENSELSTTPYINVSQAGGPPVFLDLDREEFHWDLDKLIQSPYLDPDYQQDLEAKSQMLPNAPKYFYEPRIKKPSREGAEHYDWRFFKGFQPVNRISLMNHRTLRAWSQFCLQHGILSIIAHGSLLGWFWNGLSLPWDSDNDVQMPIKELDRVSRVYNNSLVVFEDPFTLDRQYFYLELNPWYIQRVRADGANVIDGRFINIHTGIYVDITALANTKPDSPSSYNCKNNHYYKHERLLPLRKTLYEGVPTYVPNDFLTVLTEYKRSLWPFYKNRYFDTDLKLWLSRKACQNYTNPLLKFRDGELTAYGACYLHEIWNEYNVTNELTKLHAQEMFLLPDISTDRQIYERFKNLLTKIFPSIRSHIP